jgi:hypothetical protein
MKLMPHPHCLLLHWAALICPRAEQLYPMPAFSPGVSPSSAALAGSGSELGRAGTSSPGAVRL